MPSPEKNPAGAHVPILSPVNLTPSQRLSAGHTCAVRPLTVVLFISRSLIILLSTQIPSAAELERLESSFSHQQDNLCARGHRRTDDRTKR